MSWQDISTAPKDGTRFLALNHDGEIWVAKFEQRHGRLCFRTNSLREGRSYIARQIDGEEWIKEDKAFAEANTAWSNNWTLWTRGYEFKPTRWAPLPPTEQHTPASEIAGAVEGEG